MSKIYAVVKSVADHDDIILKAFKDVNLAIEYKEDLEQEEKMLQTISKECKSCNRENMKCPFYMPAFRKDDGCENYDLFHEDVYYKVVKVELDEKTI